MKIMKLEELIGHDVFEFSYAYNFNNPDDVEHWYKDSLYVSDDDFSKIEKYINKHIDNFPYYGPPFKMTYVLWDKIKNSALSDLCSKEISLFLKEIEIWINAHLDKDDFFWIIGV